MENYKKQYLNEKISYTNQKSFSLCAPDEITKKRLDMLIKNDLEGFNKRNWSMVEKIYDKNLVARMGGGMVVNGLDQYMKMAEIGMQAMPDVKITNHEVAFGCGDFTCVVANMEGTFTGPMKNPDGTKTDPTQKHFKNRYSVVSKWQGLKIIREDTYWDQDMDKAMGVDPCKKLKK